MSLSTQLEVSTTDLAGNLVEGPAVLLITVIDQNDNRPIFKERRYTGEVLEGSPTGGWRGYLAALWRELSCYWIELDSTMTDRSKTPCAPRWE